MEKETASLKQRVFVAEAAAKAKAPPPSETERQLRRQIADLRQRLREVSRSPFGTVYLKKGDRKKLIQGCHSDDLLSPGKKQRLDEAFQIINELFQSGKLKEIDHE